MKSTDADWFYPMRIVTKRNTAHHGMSLTYADNSQQIAE